VKRDFERLVAEGAGESTEGWDFSWFDGRATEDRPSWGYARLAAQRLAAASAALDVQTGGGEVLGHSGVSPPLIVATESWLPNAALAQSRLRPLRGHVVAADNDVLPFAAGTFDLVLARHPVTTPWNEIGRVLAPGGTFLSQQVGAGSNRELIEFMLGEEPVGTARRPDRHVAAATVAGLDVVDLREERLRVEFFDVGAVVYFLRKVLWTVPGFTVEAYRHRLAEMHEQIVREGSFVAHSERFLIEAHRPT
jgi:SAM-dependent methyltransferase